MNTLRQVYDNLPLSKTPIWGDEKHPAGCDKGTTHSYIEHYDKIFKEFKDKPIKMMEIGAAYGGSAKLWNGYFKDLELDSYELECHLFPETVKYFEEQSNLSLICANALKDEEPAKNGKGYYDIILDDGSHYLNDQIRAAQLWYDSVKPGGLYIIEDVWYENIETLSNLYPNANSLDLREERIYKIVNGVKFYRDDNAIVYWKKE